MSDSCATGCAGETTVGNYGAALIQLRIALQLFLEGKGGGAVMKNHPHDVRHVSVSNPFELADADTPETLELLKGLCHD